MKKLIALLFIGILSTSAFAQQQQERKIKSNGVAMEKKRRVPKYTKLLIEGEVIVEILNNDFNKEILTFGDANLHQLLQISVVNELLTIKRKPGFTIIGQTTPLRVKLTTKDLTDITVIGNKANVANMGVFEASKLSLTNTGDGKLDLRVKVDELEIKTENNASITVDGNANILKITSNSSGDINLQDLSNFYTEITSNGSGNVYTNTVNTIDGEINGSGNVYYKFTKTLNITENGEGKILKHEN